MQVAIKHLRDALRLSIRAICDDLSAGGAGLLLDTACGEEIQAITAGLPAELVEDYRYHYAACCPLPHLLAGLRPGTFHAVDTWQDPMFIRLDDLQHGLLRRYGIRHIAIGHWPLPGGASAKFGFQRGDSQAPFAPEELLLLERRTESLANTVADNFVAPDTHVARALQGCFELSVTPMLLLT